MSRQPEELVDYKDLIRAHYLRCDLKPDRLYTYFLEVLFEHGRRPGHGQGRDAWKHWMAAKSEPNATEMCFVQRAINKRLDEIGDEGSRLEEFPLPKAVGGGSDDGDRLASVSEGSAKGGYLKVA